MSEQGGAPVELWEAEFPFSGRNPTAAELRAMGGDYAAVAEYAESNPLHAHFRAWGIWCREHGGWLAGVDDVTEAVPLGRECPNCDQDRWVVVETPDDEEWSAEHYCATCGYMTLVWRSNR